MSACLLITDLFFCVICLITCICVEINAFLLTVGILTGITFVIVDVLDLIQIFQNRFKDIDGFVIKRISVDL